jgi:ubiquinone/menaquinone biosynthesis C-methylase UbiE
MQNKETINYYNGIAKGYKELYHEEQRKKIEYLKKQIVKQGIILDLGSGDGVLNQYVIDTVNFISCDISKELLKLNKSKNKILCDIHYLPFKSNSINQVISLTAIQDTTNPKIVIKEIKRVLKKNGSVILTLLKISKKSKIIIEEIKNNFKIKKQIEEEKDYIISALKK